MMKAFVMVALLTGLNVAAPAAPPIRIQMDPIAASAEPGAIALGTGGVPGMPAESWYADRGDRRVRNVSRATLTPVLPDPAKATGAAVIIAPGGGFQQLSMDGEGWAVARWLADHGIAAFVLKYRLEPTPADLKDYNKAIVARIAAMTAPGGKPPEIRTPPYVVTDALAALHLVRARGAGWRVDPRRVGMIGFSAGAMTTLAAGLQAKAADRPDFIGSIYGPMLAVTLPADAPPLFVGLAADDDLFGGQGYGLVESWRAAGRPYELHVFQKSGHGYAMGTPGTTTAGWIEGFYRWIDMNGFLARPVAQ